MPRSSGVYSAPPGTTVTTNTAIASAPYNAFVADIVAEQNLARPVAVGGTGATSPDAALTNLGATATGKSVFTAASKAAAQTALGAELPAGALMFYVMATAPSGWLKANGAAVSRTTYAALFAVIGTSFGAGDGSTTFNVPDFRGEFLRALDDGRGIDPGRGLGSPQAAAMLDHTHSGTTSPAGGHNHPLTFGYRNAADGGFGSQYFGSPMVPPGAGGQTGTSTRNDMIGATPDHTHTITTGNPSAGGGTETRPRNVACLICIKY